MDRRTFLLGLAAACGSKVAPKPKAPRKPPADAGTSPPEEGLGADRPPVQLQRSPIALHGDLLVQRISGGLAFRDATTLAKLGDVELRLEAFCFMPNGWVAAYVQPYGAKRCEVHVIDDQRQVKVFVGPEFVKSYDPEMVPGRSSHELFVSDDNYDIVRMELREPNEARATGRVKPDLSTWKRLRQLASLGDGRIVTRGAHALLVQEPGKPNVEYATGDETVVHVSAAGASRIWYSYALGSNPNIDGIALATLGDKLAVEARAGFAPWTVTHIAASGTSLAVLATKLGAAVVALLDDHGSERWRVDVPGDFYTPDRFPDDAWIALSDHRVVVATKRGPELLALDAATGKRVG